MSDFPGFSKDLTKFLKGLEANNEKAWLDANRATYDAVYADAAKDFVAAMSVPLQKIAPGIRAEPKVNGSIMRINRDTRFSKDKTPYKTGMGLIFWDGPGKRMMHPGFYMWISPTEVALGAGLPEFQPKQLERYRKAAADPASGKALRDAVKKVQGKGDYTFAEPRYKRVPKGCDADHPNAEFLRRSGLFIGRRVKHPPELFTGKAVKWAVGEFTRMAPVQRWLVDAIE